ncbi:hypothetical protein [Actinoallomurus sp. NPDC050550]|uniref:glycoside hydrolase family 38 N-terminal domain-containing protein n=1 Tax=Actinoallomurus sp. NPDC050550 TaxID=3154937 RepID=UPI0033DC1620
MTKLTAPSWWDVDLARDGLRRSAMTAEIRLGGRDVMIYAEPLLRTDGGAGLLQSIRIEISGSDTPAITHALVRTETDAAVRCDVLPAPRGTVRLLVPMVDVVTRLLVELPELEPGRQVDLRLEPQRRWTIHLVHQSHLDIGYTDLQGTVFAQGRTYLDTCLELARATDDWPDEARFRWAVEALTSFERWAKARPATQVEEFINRVREGRFELTALPFNLHTEACSTDELHELLRPAARVRDAYGVSFATAMQTDVPGQVVGLPDALTSFGVRYLSVAHNWAGRAVPHLVGGARLPRLFRWRAPSGTSVLVWQTDTPHGLAYMEGAFLGFHQSYEDVDDLLPAYLTALATNPYPFPEKGIPGYPVLGASVDREPYPWDVLHLRVLGTFSDNGPPRSLAAETVRQWNETWAYPRLRLSRNEDFFADIEERLGDSIATFDGDWTDWWVDGIGAGAEPLALTRQAQSGVADAQTVSAFATALGASPELSPTPVYESISMFNEHTWGASDPWTHGDHGRQSGARQWHWKYAQAIDAYDEALVQLDTAAASLGQALERTPGCLATFHVLNTCSWSRSDVVRVFLPESTVPRDQPVAVVCDGKRLQFSEEKPTDEDHDVPGRYLAVFIRNVPAMGTLRLDVVAATDSAAVAPTTVVSDPTLLENEYLAVRVDLSQACISSIVDKATGRELVRQDAVFGFNGYIYDQYATAGGFNHQSGKIVADDSMHLLSARDVAPPAALISRQSSATEEQIVYECVPAGTTRLRTTLRLAHGVARLDVENRLAKSATMGKESAFFAFPFAMSSPKVRMEATGGVTGDGLPVVPGSAPHMRAIRRWATLESADLTVAWATQDAPLVQHGGIALPYLPYPQTVPQHEPGTLYSWVHNNIWDTNFPSEQAFDFVFRYSVAASHEVQGTVLGMRTAAAGSRPLLAVRALGPYGDGPATRSLLTIEDPRVRIVGLTVPRPGAILIRLQSFAEQPVSSDLRIGFPVTAIRSATYLGSPKESLPRRSDGAVPVEIPALSTRAVLMECVPPAQ